MAKEKLTTNLLNLAYAEMRRWLAPLKSNLDLSVIDFSFWLDGKKADKPYLYSNDNGEWIVHVEENKEINIDPSTNVAIQDEESDERIFFEWFYEEFSKNF